MDVVYFAPLLDTGGTQRHILELCLALDPKRFRPTVCCLHGRGTMRRLFTDAGVEIHDIGIGRRFFSPRSLVGFKRTVSWLRQVRPPVVHAYQCRPSIFATVAARLAGVPVVIVSKRSFDRQNPALERLWRWTNHLATAVLVNSEALARQVRSEGIESNLVLIPCGVDTKRFSPKNTALAKKRLGLTAGTPIVGSVGRLIKRKGHEYLVKALAALVARGRPVELLLVGEGPERAALERLSARLGVRPHVHLLGERSDVRECIAAMDLFALPSLHEGMSNALLEAMAMAKPVVVSDGPGNPEVVRHGSNGLIVSAGDAEGLRQAIESILSNSSMAHRLGEAARDLVEAGFSTRSMVARFEELYTSLIQEAGTGSRAAMTTQERPV